MLDISREDKLMAKTNKQKMNEIENLKYEVAQEMGLPQSKTKKKKDKNKNKKS